MARSEKTEHSFLVLIQKFHVLNSVLKIPFESVCRLITPQARGRCVASWNFNCIWFMYPTSKSKSKVLLKLCMKLFTLVWNYSVSFQSS